MKLTKMKNKKTIRSMMKKYMKKMIVKCKIMIQKMMIMMNNMINKIDLMKENSLNSSKSKKMKKFISNL